MPKAQHAARYRRLPAFLRQMRSEAGLTQRDIARLMNISHVAVHKCETGDRRVDVAEFMDWAKACKIDPVDAFRQFARRG